MGNFIYHGPLPADSRLFRGRQKELNKLLRICLGVEQSYAIVYGGHQMGKTSLLMRLEHDLSIKGVRSCRVDFQGFAREATPRVFNHIFRTITGRLSIETGIREVNDAAQFTAFLRQAVECIAPKRFTLMLEEMGALLPETQYVLANAIRANFTNRYMDNYRPLDQLTVVLAGGVELRDLAVMEASPLDNICEQIYLSDLSEEDAIGLIRDGLELDDTAWAETLGQAVYAQVKGFPYLTQRIGAKLDEEIKTGKQDATERVERAVEEILAEDSLLVHLHKALKDHGLGPALQTLLEEPVPYTRIANELVHLELLGLIVEASNYWVVRNMLLKRALTMWSGDLYKKAHFERAIARIYDAKTGTPVGAGFLNKDCKVVTCAHVVIAALQLPHNTRQMPIEQIDLDFPFATENKRLAAKITCWQFDDDIAYLELTTPPPQGVVPVPILRASRLWGHFFRAFGFPAGYPDGVWASGVLRDFIANNSKWLQIEDTKAQGFRVQPGFSGGLVWDENLDSVVGMVAAADRQIDSKVAFAIPATLFP
ncbi:MAG TPA: AAA-like domain-containing protein [Anaerolineales bacterium]|nr:AAA-like domain-containing protein [Anaerolineales bacterium]